MKFIKQKFEGEHDRYYFALGKEEAVMVLALLDKASRYTPKTIETEVFLHRVASMRSAIAKALPEIRDSSR